MKKTTINERLKELRTAAVKTQGEFAHDIGVSLSLYSKIEIGEKEVTPKVIEKVITSYRVPSLWLREGIGELSFDLPNHQSGGDFNPAVDTLYNEMKEQIAFLRETIRALTAGRNFHKVTNLPSLSKNRRRLVTSAD